MQHLLAQRVVVLRWQGLEPELSAAPRALGAEIAAIDDADLPGLAAGRGACGRRCGRRVPGGSLVAMLGERRCRGLVPASGRRGLLLALSTGGLLGIPGLVLPLLVGRLLARAGMLALVLARTALLTGLIRLPGIGGWGLALLVGGLLAWLS